MISSQNQYAYFVQINLLLNQNNMLFRKQKIESMLTVVKLRMSCQMPLTRLKKNNLSDDAALCRYVS